jgi:hypothetical protein
MSHRLRAAPARVLSASLCAIVAGAAVWACAEEQMNAAPSRPRQTPTDPNEAGINTSGAGAGSGANTGLPCDVQQVLENRCVGCHLSTSPPPLLTYEDLLRTGSDGKTLAVKSLERMKDTARPMPPAPAVPPTPDEITILQRWVDARTPRAQACTGIDGGTSRASSYDTPTVCTSNKTWGGEQSAEMDPGAACITCHLRKGPNFTIAGTVYPTAHEPNDCYGISSATLKVVVTDAQGKTLTLGVNQTGNFRSNSPLAPPFHVKVVDGTKERLMAGSLTAGDCNSCHTVGGANGAPGRVMAP